MRRPIPDGLVTEIRKVGLDDFDAIYRRLLSGLNPALGEDAWRRLFTYRWAGAEAYAGYALYEQQVPVGFIGLLFGERSIRGRVERFCNVTSWVVEHAYRNQGVSLLMPVVRLQDCTVTNLTSIPAVHKIFSSLGFKTLDTHVRVLWPVLLSGAARGVAVDANVDDIVALVPPTIQAIVRDHRPYVHQILLREGDQQCLVVYRIGRWRRMRVARIHHIEGAELFTRALGKLRRALLRRHGALLLEMDERLLPPGTPWTTRVPLPVPRLYRSDRLSPADVSNLYSELVLLPF